MTPGEALKKSLNRLREGLPQLQEPPIKILTSYFYQIRFFKPYYIPLSTAVYDPKWYHQNRGPLYQFEDKNGVINGIRIQPFIPDRRCEGLCSGSEDCVTKDPRSCNFLKQYYNQLNELDFNEIMRRFQNLSEDIKQLKSLDKEPIFVLIFHETPTNPCSERWMVQKWFMNNGYQIKEFDKTKIN